MPLGILIPFNRKHCPPPLSKRALLLIRKEIESIFRTKGITLPTSTETLSFEQKKCKIPRHPIIKLVKRRC